MRSAIRSVLKDPSRIAIFLMVTAMLAINLNHHNWSRGRVIEWDVKSYYAYLPAVFIYNDLSLEFIDHNPEKFGDLIWPVTTPTGKRAIITTMGMSVLYAPFFFLAHAYALVSGWEADGYSTPYRFALNFSSLFYVILGMIMLRKILLRYFGRGVATFSLVAVVMGTNLLYYATHEGAMTHAYSFALIALFLWLSIRFWEQPAPAGRQIMLLGFLAGFITLVRPTNIIVLLLFFLWGVNSLESLKHRIRWFARHYHLPALMAAFFILAWVPQFIYWKQVSGMFFYFTYGEEGGGFFWHNPQISNILFSYKKGWFVYTPIMFLAFCGIFLLPRPPKGLHPALREAFLPILLFKLLNIYILSSWWSWWFGGGFGLRAFVDAYAIMAIPLAALISWGWQQRRMVKMPALAFLGMLIWFNYFQIQQYRRLAIHYWWMNKEAYWETFLKRKPTERYWELITIPDYEKARQGIYVAIDPDPPSTPEKEDELRTEADPDVLEAIERRLRNDPDMARFIENKAREQQVPVDTMFRRDALWYYKRGED